MVDWRAVVAVFLGAGLGGVFRYAVSMGWAARFGPDNGFLATAIINVSGSFLIGIVVALAVDAGTLSPMWRLFLATGVLGGFTTFSTFALELVLLAGNRSAWLALAYAVGSVVIGLAGAWGGGALIRLAVR